MTDDPTDALLDAALMHVPFDGWSETTFRAAIADSGIDATVARGLFPRGAIDLARAYHRRGDRIMQDRLAATDMAGMRFRDKVVLAVRTRIEASENREAVRRGSTFFSLPPYAAEGARMIWDTADAILLAIGDTSEDGTWYTKRLSLSGVYSATVLYWLGDDSVGHHETWGFLDRRIEDVMRFEKAKATARKTPLVGPLVALPETLLSRLRRPGGGRRHDIPGGARD
ncbi:COQ9 family protein [Roseivivax isoporae]|uniref:RpsU-divergently transcribed protein n=1 Tax=Roseivivax isoporae LMG 25204 TaxID=1449351 RepID=X7F4Y9_9RHOB|nr:COQ9 family protein [Roseivivax isoporae]ETX27119.1 rpsU-divergently transcribed protein [Roseivivax isoporae LMG 25204]